jgi:hypothetical protein
MSLTLSIIYTWHSKIAKGNYMNRTVFHCTVAIIFLAACSAWAQGQAGPSAEDAEPKGPTN